MTIINEAVDIQYIITVTTIDVFVACRQVDFISVFRTNDGIVTLA